MPDALIQPFTLAIDDAALSDLRRRLGDTRWPERETVPDWSQGAPLANVQELCDYWRTDYDWRRCEAMLNGFGQYRTEIDGLGIHFIHVRSPEPDAMPIILTHGWPGSVIEFHKVIGPLTDPVAHGGNARDAFHVVIPSLPGYGFSDKPNKTGWNIDHIGDAWRELMRRLGYDRYVAQGGDWGSSVTLAIAQARAPECIAIHLNMVLAPPDKDDLADLTDAEKAALASIKRHSQVGTGYSKQQTTRPQTLGYGLADSPAGQAAWIYEKYHEWADCGGDPRSVLSLDDMLDNIMLYWLPGNGASSARLYWESFANSFKRQPLSLPVGCSIFPGEMSRPSRRWAERLYPNIIHWNEPERGGHFAAFEQPDIFVAELRNCFRSLRN
jgi:pimeloyl-ACP methyl ester carboxylesterase